LLSYHPQVFTAAAIFAHNFPEGLATFVGTLADPAAGASLAFAIGLHNIPEGICVGAPLYRAAVAEGPRDADGKPRARPHCRCALPCIHSIPDALKHTRSVPLLLKRQSDRTLGKPTAASIRSARLKAFGASFLSGVSEPVGGQGC
jgi:hypothetical protein